MTAFRRAAASGDAVPAPASPSTRAGVGLLVLVVDDDPLLRDLTVLLVEELGHRADAVGDGEQAVRAVRNGRYDLVLMDYDMPRRDGPSATREIRRMDGVCARLPIVMVSGRHDAASIAEAHAAGVDAYFTKPFRIDALRRLLDELSSGGLRSV